LFHEPLDGVRNLQPEKKKVMYRRMFLHNRISHTDTQQMSEIQPSWFMPTEEAGYTTYIDLPQKK